MKKTIFLAFLLATGYSLFSQMSVSVAEIKNSNLYFNKTVFIEGQVSQVDKILSSICEYMLQDIKGNTILVRSAHGCPDLNKEYSVKGRASRDEVSFMVYFDEEGRKLKAVPPPPSETIDIIDDELDNAEAADDENLELDNMDIDEKTEVMVIETTEDEEEKEDVFFIVEDMPKFQGGDINNFRKFIQENLQYPDSAAAHGISGKVFVQFDINSTGQVVNVKVMRGVDPYLDAEALRVINSSPQWEPGMQRGKPVSVRFTFPIIFILQ
jgi:TonB family protein